MELKLVSVQSCVCVCACVCVCMCVCVHVCVCMCVCMYVCCQKSNDCADCGWLEQRSDWVDLTLSALCYLAAEVGGTMCFL